MPLLTIELVPSTAWWSNVRSNVTRTEWEKCKNYVKQRSGSKCEICGGVGTRYPVDCHEVWEYTVEMTRDGSARFVQTLVDLIALCPACHECKHLGRAMQIGNGDRAIAHLQAVNGWDDDTAYNYAMGTFNLWRARSQHQWELDVSFLSLLGIEANVKDRENSRDFGK